MQKSETIGELSKALGKAQSQFPQIKRSSRVDFTTSGGIKVRYSYAPLSEIFDAIKKPLTENELMISQPTAIIDGKLIVETILSHSSGEWISGQILIESQKVDPQSIGSALTYARRYALSALLGIASEEDDDAEGATEREKETPTPAEDICPVHGVPFKKYTKGDQEWWSHKTKDGWCSKDKVIKAADEPPLVAALEKMGAIPEFKNFGDFFMQAFRKWKITKSQTMKLLEVTSIEQLKDLTGAWVALTELMKEV